MISMSHEGKDRDLSVIKNAKWVMPENFDVDCYMANLRLDFLNSLQTGSPLNPKPSFCAATTGMYIFCPDGMIYACYEGVGQEHSLIGQYDPIFCWHDKNLKKWQGGRDLEKMPKCHQCPFLFFCGTGCPIHSYQKGKKWSCGDCDNFKERFSMMVKSLFADSDKTSQAPL